MSYHTSQQKIYRNPSSPTLLNYIDESHKKILDVGCGYGQNAQLIKNKYPGVSIDGITISEDEQKYCLDKYDQCFLVDINKNLEKLKKYQYDLVIFSHVLEHLVYPKKVLNKFHKLMAKSGTIFISVPNFSHYINRFNILRGKFEYTEEGILDFTHLRFFNYFNVRKLLIDENKYKIIKFEVRGLHPKTILNKYIGTNFTSFIDHLTLNLLPNLFAEEMIILLKKK